tara:strand:- start:878 stop:1174 length:297 start_codon:yes stop_codon:yes gene_type:complete
MRKFIRFAVKDSLEDLEFTLDEGFPEQDIDENLESTIVLSGKHGLRFMYNTDYVSRTKHPHLKAKDLHELLDRWIAEFEKDKARWQQDINDKIYDAEN